MREGTFTYYTLQHRIIQRTPWNKPKEPLKPVKDEWGCTNWETFGWVIEPWHGTGNNYRPKYRKAHDEIHNVWEKTRRRGWWTFKFAVRGLKRVREADAKGVFDYKEHETSKVVQRVRHEFRLVKVTGSKKTEVADTEELIDQLVSC